MRFLESYENFCEDLSHNSTKNVNANNLEHKNRNIIGDNFDFQSMDKNSTFENNYKITENFNVNKYYHEYVVKVLQRLIEGFKVKLSDLDVINAYFRGRIPAELKYSGPLYRYVFFDNEYDYEECLQEGLFAMENSFLSCTKVMNNKEIMLQTIGAGYEFYVLFEIQTSVEKCIFDVNKLCEIVGVDTEYGHEDEVIIESIDLPPNQIIDHGSV
jgi:hypothetical protein